MKMRHKNCGGEVVEKGDYYPHIWITTDGKVGRYPLLHCTSCKKNLRSEYEVKGGSVTFILSVLLDKICGKEGKVSDWEYPRDVDWAKTEVLEGVIVDILTIRFREGGGGKDAILRCKDGELQTIRGYTTLWPLFELRPGVWIKVNNLGMTTGKAIKRRIRTFSIELNVGNPFDFAEHERLFE